MSGLRLRADTARISSNGVWRSGMTGGLGFDGEYRLRGDPPWMVRARARANTERGLRGLGDDPETILNTDRPVEMYVRAIQALISTLPEYHTVGDTPPAKEIVSNGIWDFATHNGVLDFVVSLSPTESSLANMPRWGENPALMAHFVIDLFLVGMEDSRIRESFAVFYETLGVPQAHEQTTDSIFQLFSLSRESEQRRMVGIMDKVMRYIIGAEGGQVYGSKPVQYEGIAAGVAAVVGSVSAILLVG